MMTLSTENLQEFYTSSQWPLVSTFIVYKWIRFLFCHISLIHHSSYCYILHWFSITMLAWINCSETVIHLYLLLFISSKSTYKWGTQQVIHQKDLKHEISRLIHICELETDVLDYCILFFLQTEHKMSIEEVCRKYNTDIVQVRVSHLQWTSTANVTFTSLKQENWWLIVLQK